MKKWSVFYLLALFTFSLQLNAQVANQNPDPNGEPWWTGDAVAPSPEEMALIPKLLLTPESAATLLPEQVFNNELMYFPPIFHQKGASCVQAAEIGYTFTYEINRLRNVASGDWDNANNRENLYHHLFTYNFLNNGTDTIYTTYTSGFKILKDNGCPEYYVYDDPALYGVNKFKYWMTGHEKYHSGMKNGISGYSYIYFNTEYESLDTLKHWLADHNEGVETGGLAVIAVLTDFWNDNNTLPADSPHAGEKLITKWGTDPESGHALTIVGYDDNVKYDFDDDGDYTITKDINGDGAINLLDREIGAFKVANSWGEWANDGFIWVPYKLMADGLQIANRAHVCHAQDGYEPSLTVKANVEYPERNKLGFKVGYAQNAYQTEPINSTFYNSFKYQGGANQMRGAYSGPIETGLDFGHWYQNEDVGKIFFIVDENESGIPTSGLIEYFSIVDYRWGEVFELFCDETNVSIVNNDETVLSIDYDLVPHESDIVTNLSLFSNMVSRFTPTVDGNATLTVEDGVRIDMYDSEIHIKPGSTLQLNSNSKIIAKRGQCKIIVDGDILIYPDVQFIAEGDA